MCRVYLLSSRPAVSYSETWLLRRKMVATHSCVTLCSVFCDDLKLRPADQTQLVLVLAKVHDVVALQDQHLGY